MTRGAPVRGWNKHFPQENKVFYQNDNFRPAVGFQPNKNDAQKETFWKETLLDQTPVDTLRAFKVFETAEQ